MESLFIQTYSDDLICLAEARYALYTHPLKSVPEIIYDAAFGRIYAVAMVGSLEAVLEAWRDKDGMKVVEAWFPPKKKNEVTPNEVRVKGLLDAFRSVGADVDQAVFDDFLAIKYLRNKIVHADWGEDGSSQREWIKNRGFPDDPRRLSKAHLEKMHWVNQNMTAYIAKIGIAESPEGVRNFDWKSAKTELRDTTGVIRSRQLPALFWNNIERVFDVLEAAAKGARSDAVPQEALEELCAEGISSWKEFWTRTVEREGISLDAIRRANAVLNRFHLNGWYEFAQIPASERNQLYEAEAIGERVNAIIKNMFALSLLTYAIPAVSNNISQELLDETDRAFQATELMESWSCYVKDQGPPDFVKYERYRKKIEETQKLKQ